MDTLVLEPLTSIETHLNALITSLTQTNTFTNAPQLAQDLLNDDDDLTSALSLLQRHQQNYARILNLREEVTSLQEQLKDTVRKCVSFKQEIGQINPLILESDSEEEEDHDEDDQGVTHVAEVDYHTLLTFAARIGKHNTIAAKEAEAEAVRRKIAARNPTSTSTSAVIATTVNGTQSFTLTNDPSATQDTFATATAPTAPPPEGEAELDPENNTGTGTAETSAELSRIDNTIAIQRAQMGMSFPDAAALRTGALGQLQLFREKQEASFSTGLDDDERSRLIAEAVDREVGKMVCETEDIAQEEEKKIEDDNKDEEAEFPDSPVLGRKEGAAPPAAARQTSSTTTSNLPGQAQAPVKPSQPKRKLDLDFPDSDDEDED